MSENPTSFFKSPLTGVGYHTEIPDWDLGDSIKPKFPLDSIPASAWQVGEKKEEKPGFLDKAGENFTSYLDQEKKNAQRQRAYDAYYDSLKRARDKSAVTADLGGGNTLFAPDQSRYLQGMGAVGSQGSSSGGVGRFAGQALGSALAGAVPGVGPFLAPVGAAIGGFFGDKLPF